MMNSAITLDEEEDTAFDTNTLANLPVANGLMEMIQRAQGTIKQVIDFGRQKHDIGAAVQQAGRMPSVPGNQSESGRPPVRPMPGPLPPTSNPFGKRAGIDENVDGDGSFDVAARMPMKPGTQSESGIPPERPKPPASAIDTGEEPFEMAAAMPTIPGTQSESGIPPERPKPPPTQYEEEYDEEQA